MTLAMARLVWKRLWRGKMVWISAVVALLPPAVAVGAARELGPGRAFALVVEMVLRSVVLLVPALLLAPVVGDESERKTYTYLWSRPVPRTALLWGNLLVMAPLAAAAAAATLAAASAIAGGAGEDLARAELAALVGVAGASAFALGVGALVPRHPLVVTLAWVLIGEQILTAIPAAQNLSIVHHARALAGLRAGDPVGAAVAVAILAAIWLGVAAWRVRSMEFGRADG
jgi:hypothetical protein